MSFSSLKELDNSDVAIHKLPIEIITKIISYLSLSDILNLACVSKIWRSYYLNQNIIWMNICEKMNLGEYDYIKCFGDFNRNNADCKDYVESNSVKLFGPFCLWWSIFNRYNMVLQNIKVNDFATTHVTRRSCDTTYCTDDYIITVNRYRKYPITANILQCASNSESRRTIKVSNFFKKLNSMRDNVVKIVGNKKYVVFEIHSFIFVYAIEDGFFVQRGVKFLSPCRSIDDINFDELDTEVLERILADNKNTLMDIDEEHLALVQPNKNLLFVYDLANMKISRNYIYSRRSNTVQCLKYDFKRVMIGITCKPRTLGASPESLAIIYHWEKSNLPFKVSMFAPVQKFKTTHFLIGVENTAAETPFISRVNNIYKVFWVDCDTFSIDSTRKYIYFNINSSIFKYDLNKSLEERYEVTEKIATDLIATRYSLTPINDRFLVVLSIIPNSYDIFDVKDHIVVRSIQLNPGYTLVHVGKLSIVFSNSKEFLVVGFY